MAWCLATLLILIFQCHPIKAIWDVTLVPAGRGSCLPIGKFYLGYELSNMALDVAILCLPMRVIRGLQMDLGRKVAISCVFLLGGFVCIVCVIRSVYVYNGTDSDNVDDLPKGLTWGTVELAVAIVCACLPTYGPLIKNLGLGIYRLTSYLRKFRTKSSGSGRTVARADKE